MTIWSLWILHILFIKFVNTPAPYPPQGWASSFLQRSCESEHNGGGVHVRKKPETKIDSKQNYLAVECQAKSRTASLGVCAIVDSLHISRPDDITAINRYSARLSKASGIPWYIPVMEMLKWCLYLHSTFFWLVKAVFTDDYSKSFFTVSHFMSLSLTKLDGLLVSLWWLI